ncbi:MAG: hypothetical protein AAF628_17585 [Planctomycetota bacterium]
MSSSTPRVRVVISSAVTSLVLPLTLAAAVTAQGPADVLRFYETPARGIALVDGNGTIVHEWRTGFLRNGAYEILQDGTLVHKGPTGVRGLGFDGSLRWTYTPPPGLVQHHDMEPLANGNVLFIARESKTRAEAIARGRNPYTVGPFLEFGVLIEVKPTGPTSGDIVWEWHVWDHLIQDFDPAQENYGVVADHPERIDINYPAVPFAGVEFNHLNGLDVEPGREWIALTSPTHDEVWIIDHSTTTAEAAGSSGGRAGKGGDLLYRWGNPAVYQAAPAAAKQLDFVHDPRFIPPDYPGAGNLTLFNNGITAVASEALEIVLPVDELGRFERSNGGAFGPRGPVWSYSSPGFVSFVKSSAERLPNGNTLICSGRQAWVFEVTPAGQIAWEQRYTTPGFEIFHAHHTRRSLWASAEAVAASAGMTVQFDFAAGSPWGGSPYVVLGSASGTSPGTPLAGTLLRLNQDLYFRSIVSVAGSGLFASWVGTLDAAGTAQATLALPAMPAAAVAGVHLHHAVLTVNSAGLGWGSNAVPLRLTP